MSFSSYFVTRLCIESNYFRNNFLQRIKVLYFIRSKCRHKSCTSICHNFPFLPLRKSCQALSFSRQIPLSWKKEKNVMSFTVFNELWLQRILDSFICIRVSFQRHGYSRNQWVILIESEFPLNLTNLMVRFYFLSFYDQSHVVLL